MAGVRKRQSPADRLRRLSKTAVGTDVAAKDMLVPAVERAKGPASRIVDRAKTLRLVTDIVKLLQSESGRALDKMFPKCPVPVYLLPTGSRAKDFQLTFDLDELMVELKSGVFVRPLIEVWAGRADFDHDRLAENLRDEFVSQFNEARDSEHQALEADLENIESRKNRAKDEMVKPLEGIAGAGITNMLLDPSGIGAVLLLGFALFKVKKAAGPLQKYVDLSAQKGVLEKEMRGRLRELDEQFEGKNKVLRRAVKRLDVKVHPRLQELVELFCEVDHIPFVPVEYGGDKAQLPDVVEFLLLPKYVAVFPTIYRPLLDSITLSTPER